MEENIAQLKGLADANRLRILNLLLTHDLCVGALAHHLRLSKPAVSQHLKVLRVAGLVKGEKRGYFTHYLVQREALRQVGESLVGMAEQTPTGESCLVMLETKPARAAKARKAK
jgi:DNA-binding transcriptional ArsR family regulator